MSTEITNDGILNTNVIEVVCPTCQGFGSIPDPQYKNMPMAYCGYHGERSPHIPCRTCDSIGWIKKSV